MVPTAPDSMNSEAKRLKPRPGTALVYVYREFGSGGGDQLMTVCDARDSAAGLLGDGTYLYFYVPTGSLGISAAYHRSSYASCSGSNKAHGLQVEEGKTYYLRPVWQGPWFQGLEIAPEKSGAAALDVMQLAAPGTFEFKSAAALVLEEQPKRAWENALRANSVEGYRQFIAVYPNNPDARTANDAVQQILTEQKDYQQATKASSTALYRAFLNKYPRSAHRQEVLAALAALLAKKSDAAQEFLKFKTDYPDGESLIPVEYALDFIGPEGMTVADIISIKQDGMSDRLLVTKIRSSEGAYKDFTFAEIRKLQKKGLSDDVIDAMIESTSKVREKAAQQQAVQQQTAQENRRQEQASNAQAEADRRIAVAECKASCDRQVKECLNNISVARFGGGSLLEKAINLASNVATASNCVDATTCKAKCE